MNRTDMAKVLEIDPEIQRKLRELYSRDVFDIYDCLLVLEIMAEQKAVLGECPDPTHVSYVSNRFEAMVQSSSYGGRIGQDSFWERYHSAKENLGYGTRDQLEEDDRKIRKQKEGLRDRRKRHRTLTARIILGGSNDQSD